LRHERKYRKSHRPARGRRGEGMAQQAPGATRSVCRKLAVLALAVAAISLPINELTDYFILVAAGVVIFAGTITSLRSRWLAAVVLAIVVVAGHLLFPAPRIDEGHNAFLPGPDAANNPGLPRDVFAYLAREFAGQYPPERRCDYQTGGCWSHDRRSFEQGFAFSADGIFDRAPYSRRVTGIHFSDPVHLRLGFLNEGIYNWPDSTSDFQRFERDRRSFNLFNRYRVTFPLFVMYRFPAAFVGSVLCWRGDVLWEQGPGEPYEILRHADMACRPIAANDAGRRVFASSIKTDQPLAMRLTPNWTVRLRGLFAMALTFAGVIGIIGLLVRMEARRLLLPAVLLGLAFATVSLIDINFIGGFRPLDGGDDGLTYEGYARGIVRHVLAGDLAGAWRGEEPVYYFTPGFRYFRALERFVFGDTYLGYLSMILGLPFLVLGLFRRFLPASWALVIAVGFVATPVGALFGSSFLFYVKWAARGFADPLGYILLFAGLVTIIPRPQDVDDPPAVSAFAGALLLAAATFVRPNVLLTSGAMILGAVLFALHRRKWARSLALGLGFATLLVSPLHNWVFGHSSVLFSDNVSQPQTMVMPPSAYGAALIDLLHLDLSSRFVGRAIHQIASWLSGPSDLRALIPLHVAAVATLLRVGFWGARFDPWLRLIALATLLQHGTGICYANFARYHLATWLQTALVSTVWLRVEALPWIDQRFPDLRERLSSHVAVKRLVTRLARFS
jgi:hypothetical protein